MRGQIWASDLDVEVGQPAEYIYFVGCAASFDEEIRKLQEQFSNERSRIGCQDFRDARRMLWRCTRRAGNEYLFQMLAETNIMTFQNWV